MSPLKIVDGQLQFDIADGEVELNGDTTYVSGTVAIDAANGEEDVFIVERGADLSDSQFDDVDIIHFVGTPIYDIMSDTGFEVA